MLSKFSVKKPLTVVVAIILTAILGVISFTSMTTDLLPSIDLPYVAVITTYPGASPEKIELSVTKPLEQVLATTSGIKNINSISSENSSVVILEFNQGINMDSAMIEISSNIDMVESMFDDMVGSPMLMKINPDMMPIMIASVDVNGMDIKQVSKYVNDEVIPAFERIEGVASVTATGLIEERLQIALDDEKIKELNDKILASIDAKMAETKAQLDAAEAQLKEARIQFNLASSSQNEQLITGGITVAAGKTVIKETLNVLVTGLYELMANRDQAILEKTDLKLEIEAAEAEGKEVTPEQQIRLAQLESSIEIYDTSITEIEAQKKVLEGKLAEAVAGESQLNAGKVMLNEELTKMAMQLDDSEYALKQGKAEFEKASEAAYKQAGLEGALNKTTISNILMAENFSMPAGYLEENGEKYLIKVGEEFESVDEIKNLELVSMDVEGIGTIKLSDIATIDFIDNSNEIYAKINGNDGVILAFQKQSTSSTSKVSELINEAVKTLTTENPDMHITSLTDQGVYINIVIDSVLNNLFLGGILAVVILLIFLGDLKPTVIIALSIPISLLFALALMFFSGVTMNVISLAGLALGVGMLVDNSIVVIENIYRLRNEGMSAPKAAVKGAVQVSGAIFASTLTTICVFLPIVFTEGISRQLFTDMGLTIAYSLIASLIIALTLVPTMSATMLKNTVEKPNKIFDKIAASYETILAKALNHRSVILILTLALLGFSCYSVINMGTAFIPEMDSTQISVSMEMPKGSTTEEARSMSSKIIETIMTIEDVDTVGAMEGGGPMGFMGGGGNSISIYVILKEDKQLSSAEIAKLINEKTKDFECTVQANGSAMDLSALGGSGISVLVKGKDLDELKKISSEVSQILESTPGTKDVLSGIDDSSFETRITVDKNKSMKYGLTVAQVFQEISGLITSESKSTTISLGVKDYPIIIKDNSGDNLTRENINNIKLKVKVNGEEKEIFLNEIATVTQVQTLAAINHSNQVRTLTVSSAIDDDHNIGLVSRDFEKKLNDYKVPDGYTIEISGENENIKSTMMDLIKMIALAIVFIYLIMVAQFQSLLSPFIVLFTIPLAFTGGLLALLITGTEISMIAMLGFLVLSGVVVNNGIVFVDYVNQLRLEGMDKKEALILTGRTRLRPILMTALTTILGLSTLAMGMGMGADMLQPMAIVTIGGLSYATILTLFVVPIIYDILHRKPLKPIDIEED